MPLTYDNSRIVGGLMPSLDLGFSDNDYRLGLKKVGFSDIVTFSRASGGGRFNAAGRYEWLSAGQPRFDFDPVTLEPRGILIEEQRTNSLTYSEQCWDTERWGVGSTLSDFYTVTNSTDVPNIYGTSTGVAKFVANASTSYLFLRKRITFGAATYSPSIFIYVPSQAGVTSWRLYMDAADAETSASTDASTTFNRWVRVQIPTFTTAEPRFHWDFNIYQNSGTPTPGFTFYAMGAQLEVGAFPTSYIPTTTAQVTRAADLCSVNNLSPWFNAEAGAALIDYVPAGPRTNTAFALSFNADPNNYLGVGYMTSLTSSGPSYWRNAGAGGFTPTLADARYNLQNKVATTWDGVSRALTTTAGGKSPVSIKSITELPSVVRLELFRLSGLFLASGHIRRIRYIPRRISDTELQALTAI